MGYFSPRYQVEADSHWHPPAHRQHIVDDPIHHYLEVIMDELKYEILTEVQGSMEAEFIKSYLNAQGIDVELFQESVGRIYALTINGLGRVQIFVPKDQAAEARQLLEEYNNAKE